MPRGISIYIRVYTWHIFLSGNLGSVRGDTGKEVGIILISLIIFTLKMRIIYERYWQQNEIWYDDWETNTIYYIMDPFRKYVYGMMMAIWLPGAGNECF